MEISPNSVEISSDIAEISSNLENLAEKKLSSLVKLGFGGGDPPPEQLECIFGGWDPLELLD